jgi:hypothetical protein
MAESSERALTPDEASYVAAARDEPRMRYEGVPQAAWSSRVVPDELDVICNNAVRRHGDVAGRARNAFCTALAAGTAALAAQALCRFASERPAIIALEDP